MYVCMQTYKCMYLIAVAESILYNSNIIIYLRMLLWLILWNI